MDYILNDIRNLLIDSISINEVRKYINEKYNNFLNQPNEKQYEIELSEIKSGIKQNMFYYLDKIKNFNYNDVLNDLEDVYFILTGESFINEIRKDKINHLQLD